MQPLNIYAGPKALATLQSHSFSPNLFTQFLGASGGPKWFVLAGLDKALFGEFFHRHGGHMNIIGSSAGAFRAACFGQADPVAAIERLAHHYSHTVYSQKPTPQEITDKAKELLYHVLPAEGVIELLNNDDFTVHFVTARCKGLMQSEGRKRQLLGLMASAMTNAVDRTNLKLFFERVVFSAKQDRVLFKDPYNIPTQYIKMGYNTVRDALLASGAIPLVLQGVQDIVDAPAGIYRDGGIIDYHFDLSFDPSPGLTLYPHFYPSPIPGWFDKRIKSRVPHGSSYENVVMLVPSAEFIQSLPYAKIPDRKDFENMEATPRIEYWQTVISETERLGDYMLDLISKDRVGEVVRPLPFPCLLDK